MTRKATRIPRGSLFGTFAKFKTTAGGVPKVVLNPRRIDAVSEHVRRLLVSKGIASEAALCSTLNDATDAAAYHAARALILLDSAGRLDKPALAAFVAGLEYAFTHVELSIRRDVEESRARAASQPRAVAARWTGKHQPKITRARYEAAVKNARIPEGQRGHRKAVAQQLGASTQAVRDYLKKLSDPTK
jgi:hypothetical protein